jgi:branched-chain amino acid aminotransferase
METSRFIWMDGKLVAWEDATVHVLVHALHYGTGVFEGIRAYETPDGTAVFRHREHMERLHSSARAYVIELDWTVDELMDAARQVVKENELESAYIRPLVYLGAGSLGLNPTGVPTHTAIAAWRWGAYLGEEGLRRGIRVRVSSWRRLDHQSFVPNAKGTGGYANSVLAKREAIRDGYDEAILLNMRGFVTEGTGENLFVIRGDVVQTPPVSSGILDGITRATVMQVLGDDGYEVVERDLTRSDLYNADEMFFSGTAAEVTPIRELDGRAVGAGEPGPITKRAQQLFQDTVTGRLEQYRHWLDFV